MIDLFEIRYLGHNFKSWKNSNTWYICKTCNIFLGDYSVDGSNQLYWLHEIILLKNKKIIGSELINQKITCNEFIIKNTIE